MKLRIQGNLLRLRLTQKEVARLHDQGLVESAIQFPPGRALSYSVASSPDAAEVFANSRRLNLFFMLASTRMARRSCVVP